MQSSATLLYFTLLHRAAEEIFNVPTKNRVLIWLCASWKLSLLCYFLLFSQVLYFRREWGPTQSLFMFVAVWGDSLDRCRWMLFAGEKQMKSKSTAESFLLLVVRLWCPAASMPQRAAAHSADLAWHVQQTLLNLVSSDFQHFSWLFLLSCRDMSCESGRASSGSSCDTSPM